MDAGVQGFTPVLHVPCCRIGLASYDNIMERVDDDTGQQTDADQTSKRSRRRTHASKNRVAQWLVSPGALIPPPPFATQSARLSVPGPHLTCGCHCSALIIQIDDLDSVWPLQGIRPEPTVLNASEPYQASVEQLSAKQSGRCTSSAITWYPSRTHAPMCPLSA